MAELSALGFDVTQATVSRDIAELGLVKVMRGDRSVYVAPEDLAPAPRPPATSACAGSWPTSRSPSGGAA